MVSFLERDGGWEEGMDSALSLHETVSVAQVTACLYSVLGLFTSLLCGGSWAQETLGL